MSVVGTRDFHVAVARFVTALLIHFVHIDAGDLRVLHGGLLDFCQGAYKTS